MAKKSIWKRITSWLSGDSSSSKSSKSNKSSKEASSKSSTSYSSSAKQTQKDKQDNINKKKKETTAKLSSIGKNVNKNGGDYKQEVLKTKAEQKKSNQQRVLNKIAEKSFKADQANEKLQKISNAKKIETPKNLKKTTGIKVENNILQSRKDYTTKGEYDPAKSIRKGNENGSTTGYVAKGLVSAGTYGLSNPVMKRVAREDVSKALSDMDKNATKKQRRAEKTAEIVGTLASFSAANPVGRTVGKKLVGTATEKGLTSGAMRGAEALSKTKAIRNIAEATGKDAVELGAKVANELSKDLGLHLTAENLQSLAIALDKADETDGGKQEKWTAGLKEYIKQQAINTGVNATLDLAPTAIKGIKYATKDKKGTIKLAGDKLVNATKDGLTLENAPKDVIDSMPTKEVKAWKDRDFRVAIRDNEVGKSTTETVSGKVKSIDGRPYGVYKRGNSWIPVDINSGMSTAREGFKSRKAAMDYLESEEFKGLLKELESKTGFAPPENAFLEAIDNTDRVAKIKARREALANKMDAGETVTINDVADNIKDGSVGAPEQNYINAVGEHCGLDNLRYDKKRKLFYDLDTKKELFVDQFLRKARLYDKAEAEKLAKETATELPKAETPTPKKDIKVVNKGYGRKMYSVDGVEYNPYEINGNRYGIKRVDKWETKTHPFEITNLEDGTKVEGKYFATLEDAKKYLKDPEGFTAKRQRRYIETKISQQYANDAKKLLKRNPEEYKRVYGYFTDAEQKATSLYSDSVRYNGEALNIKREGFAIPDDELKAWLEANKGVDARFEPERVVNPYAKDIATPKLDDIGVPVKETEVPTPKVEVKAEAPVPKVELDETGLPKKSVLADDIPFEETPKVELDEIGVPKQETTLNEVAKNNAVDEKMLAEEIDPNQKVKVGKGVIENQKRLGGAENIEPTTVGKQAEAQARYEENYGHGALGIKGTATSRSAKTLEGMQTGRVEGQIMENLEKCGALDYEIVPHKEMENVVMEVAKKPSHYADKMNKIANGVSIETTFKGFSETSFRRTHAEGLATMQYYAQVLKDLKETGRLIPKDIKNKYADCVIAVKDMTSQAGGVLNMQRYYAALSPEQRIRVAKRDIVRLLEQNKGFRNAYKDRLSTKVGEEGIAERAGQIEEILRENKTLTDLLDKLRGADAETSAEIERLTKKLDDLEYERINTRDKISDLTRQLDEAKASNTAEVENLTRQLDEANNKLDGIDKEYRAVEDDIAIADTSGNAMTEEELSEGYTACINEVNKMMPMTALDYIQEWRYLAMLGNPKTHFRNSIGNFVFRNVRAVSNAIGSIAERGMKKQFLDQTDKTLSALKKGELDDASVSFIENQYGLKKIKNETDLKALRVKNAEKDLSDVKIGDFVTNSGSVRGKKYIENRLLERKEALEFKRQGGLSMTARSESKGEAKTELGKLGQEAWANIKNEISPESKMGIQNNAMRPRKTIVGKTVGKLAEFNSNKLELADSKAMERNFREAFYKMSKNNGLENLAKDSKEYKRLYNRIVEESTNDALEATFREYNSLADGLNKITKEMYNADASLGKKAGALVVNAVIPFAKTPANILKQSIRYSPAGLLQSSYNLRKAIKTGDVAAVNTAIDRLASGATGTGILGLGLGLSLMNPDMVTTNAGDDPDAKFEKRQGKQDYSLTVKIGDDKYSFSMDWLTPVSTTFFVGAEIANQIRKQSEDRSVFESIENIGVITSRVIEPMLETSMLSGLNNMFEGVSNSGYGTNKVKPVEKMFKTIVSDYASSLVPTLQGQISRTAYSSDKMVIGETDEEYLVNSMKNKMGLANTNFLTEAQGEKTDSWGNVVNEKKNAGDYLKSAAKNLLSPANIQKVNIGKEEKALIKEYNALRKEGIDQDAAAQIFPKPNYDKEFKFGKKELGKTEVKMTAKQLAIYNKARATGGKEAMEALLDTSLFNKKDNGALTVEQRNKLIASAPKSTEEVIRWLINRPEYKNADAEEKKTALVRVLNSSSGGKAVGNKKSSQRAVWKAQGNDPLDYDIANDLSAKQQKMYQKYKGIISKEDVIEMTKYGNGKKLYQYEDGHIRGYFTKAQMLEYLDTRTDLSTKEKAALFNIFTTGKEYGASSSRSGYGGYRRRSGGGSSSSGVNKHAAKITGLKDGKALVAKSSSKSNSKNITLERVKAKVDLPKPKY